MQLNPFANLQSDTSELNFAANATQQATAVHTTTHLSNPSAFTLRQFPAAPAQLQVQAQQQEQQQLQQQQQQQPSSKFDSHPYDGPINFRALFWVDRGPNIWALQTTIAVICLSEALLMQYLTYKVSYGRPMRALIISGAPAHLTNDQRPNQVRHRPN